MPTICCDSYVSELWGGWKQKHKGKLMSKIICLSLIFCEEHIKYKHILSDFTLNPATHSYYTCGIQSTGPMGHKSVEVLCPFTSCYNS